MSSKQDLESHECCVECKIKKEAPSKTDCKEISKKLTKFCEKLSQNENLSVMLYVWQVKKSFLGV